MPNVRKTNKIPINHLSRDKPNSQGVSNKAYSIPIIFELIPKNTKEAINIEKRVKKLIKEKRTL